MSPPYCTEIFALVHPLSQMHFLQAAFGKTFNREKVVTFLKRAALLAEIYGGFCGTGANSGYLLQLVCGRGV